MDATLERQGAVKEQEAGESSLCRHHWIIESPAGPFSKGICRLCGEERDFRNSLEGFSWDYDVASERIRPEVAYRVSVPSSDGDNSDEDA